MRKGISFWFGYEIPTEERAKMIKKAGFDCVITSADKRFNKENGTIRKQVKMFKKYGLENSSLHMRYRTEELHYFWEDSKIGEKIKKNLIKDVNVAKKYGFTCVVVHLYGEYSKIGEGRLLEVLKVCEKVNIPLAIENIDDQKTFIETFKRIKHPLLKFCYDCGHNNVFDKDFDYFKDYGDKLITLHLHDNDGSQDQHTLKKLCNSTIDWNMIGNNLKNHKSIILDYETFKKNNSNITAEEYLNEVYSQAKKLEKFIEE